MIIENGRVVAVETEAVWVETLRRSTCQSCGVRKGCGHGILSTMGAGHRHHVRALRGEFQDAPIQVDDPVAISIPERVLVQGALLVYLLPLLTLLLGAMLASSQAGAVAQADLYAFAGAVTGFAFGVAVVRWHSRVHRNNDGLQPVVVAVGENHPQTLDLAPPSQ